MNDFYYRKLNVYHKSMELFISETTRMLVGLRKNFEDKIV